MKTMILFSLFEYRFINITRYDLQMILFNILASVKNFGLKSVNVSLSIIPALRPGLLNDLKHWALALNLSLIIFRILSNKI